jgi:hypothetical protein
MMNFYRVTRAHKSRAIGDVIASDSPQDAYLMAIGFLKYLGSDLPEPVAEPGRRGRGVKVGAGPASSAGVRDEGGDHLGEPDGSGS